MVVRLLFAIAIAVSCTSPAGAAQQRFIPLLEAGDAIPPIPMVAQDGRPFTLADLHGKAIAVSFLYTRCRDPRMCPLVAAKFAHAQHAIGSAPIRFVVLTLDPAYDTPAVLTRYGRSLDQDPRYWTLATGSPAAMEELAARLGIATAATSPGSIVHSEGAFVIGPNGRLAQSIYGNDWSSAQIIDAARATLGDNHAPLISIRAWLSSAMERCGSAGVALGGTAMLGVLALALVGVGGAFWRAFRTL